MRIPRWDVFVPCAQTLGSGPAGPSVRAPGPEIPSAGAPRSDAARAQVYARGLRDGALAIAADPE
eukprot:11161233-Lingulodinium_polyedra.AAC.1